MLSIENVKHIVLDFDGVIVDSETKKFSDLQEILKGYNYDLDNSNFRNFIGKKRGQFLTEIGVSNIEEIMKKIHQKDYEITNLKLIKGLKDFLNFLKQKKMSVHIATGSSREFVLSILKKNNILQYFSEIITGDEIKESKPNPKVYLELKKRVLDKNIIVIEDSPAGVESAKKANLFVIGLGKNLNADIEFESYDEIIKYFS